MQGNGFTKENKQKVVTSALVANAAVRRPDGRVEHIVVFQKSTRLEFFWVFTSKSENTPRRAWRYASHFSRDSSLKQYSDFGTFVEYYARIKTAQVLHVRMHQPRRMAALLTKTQHETISHNWDAVYTNQGSIELVQKRAEQARKKRNFFFNERNRDIDDLQSQSTDEVLVYDDYCESCGKRHAYAHFPNSIKKCSVGFVEMKNNPGFEYRGYKPSTGFRFVYRVF